LKAVYWNADPDRGVDVEGPIAFEVPKVDEIEGTPSGDPCGTHPVGREVKLAPRSKVKGMRIRSLDDLHCGEHQTVCTCEAPLRLVTYSG